MMTTITVVSDTHLSPRAPEAIENWKAVVDHVAAAAPDLVVHTGDISLDGANDPSELSFARAWLDELAVDWLAVPGNHDLGDPFGDHACIDADRRRGYEAVFGARYWHHDIDGWRLIGLDSQDLLSGSGPSAETWAWLEATLGDATRRSSFSTDRSNRSTTARIRRGGTWSSRSAAGFAASSNAQPSWRL